MDNKEFLQHFGEFVADEFPKAQMSAWHIDYLEAILNNLRAQNHNIKDSLGVCDAPCTAAPAKAVTKKKEEIPMASISSATAILSSETIEKDQRRSLKDALYTAFRSKVDAAKKQFGIVGDDRPATPAELVARIQAGKFVLNDQYKDYNAYNVTEYIEWRDPSVKKDEDAYKAARKALDTAHDALKLKVAIIPVADALAAVEAYRDAA